MAYTKKGMRVLCKVVYTSGRHPKRLFTTPVMFLVLNLRILWSSDHISFDKQNWKEQFVQLAI